MASSDAYFVVPTGANAGQLWSTDGSPSGTTRLTPLGLPPLPIDPTQLTQAGPFLFFVDQATGDLWVTNGQRSGTRDLTGGSGITASDLTSIGQTLYFVDSSTGTLWTSNGHFSGTESVSSASGIFAEDLSAVGGTLFFVDGNTGDLWTLPSNGTATDIGNFGTIGNLTAVGNDLYFVDSTGDLWESDGTTTAQITPAAGSFTSPTDLVAAGNTLFFVDAGNETDMLMRNSNTGAFELYDISNNAITLATGMGQVGMEWSISGVSSSPAGAPPSTQLGGLAVDPAGAAPSSATAQLTQAMASFAPSGAMPGMTSPIDQTTSAAIGTLLTTNHA